MATDVLEPEVAVDVERGSKTSTPPWPRVLVDCSVCGGAHPPGDENDPRCPVEGF